MAARGSAITNEVGSVVWVECQAYARAIYYAWAVFEKAANQLNPETMSDALPRWERIMGIAALPGDTLQTRRNRIAAKFSLLGEMPNQSNVSDALDLYLGQNFVALLQGGVSSTLVGSGSHPAGSAYASWWNAAGTGYGDPISIPIENRSSDSGSQSAQFINNSDIGWYSTVNMIFVELQQLSNQTAQQFYANANQIVSILQPFLPSWVHFDWMNNTFSDDGYAAAGTRATISVTAGSTALTGVGTSWDTPMSSGRYNLAAGDILEAYDVNGDWQRLVVGTINSNTSITLETAAVSTITSAPYVMQGFFCDCNSTSWPYPPVNSTNTDNSGL
jgi:uncharacterized protein YmfQ (DUF2313 family)